jgi:hypothetical protein
VGAFTDALLQTTGDKSIDALVSRVTSEVLASVDAKSVPTDLRVVGAQFGVAKIVTTELPCDALLVPRSKSTYDIFLSRNASPRRQRFSWAHELGHAILHRLLPTTRSLATRTVFDAPGNSEEERICDQLAAGLLMPASVFITRVAGARLSVGLLRQLGDQFDVSLSAALLRCRELFQSPKVAFVSARDEGGWSSPARIDKVFMSFKGAPYLVAQRLAVRADSPLRRLRQPGEATGWEWLHQNPWVKRLCFVSVETTANTLHSRLALVSTRSLLPTEAK